MSGTGYDIALTIVALSRNRLGLSKYNYQPRYLTQVAWRWLALLKHVRKEGLPINIHISICNVDVEAETWLEARHISRYIPMFTRFNQTVKDDLPRLEKERQDYIFCLNRSLEQNPAYVFLTEDDAVPHDDVFHVLNYTLENLIKRKVQRGDFYKNTEDIAWIKFFHPEWEGFFHLYPDRIPELLSISAIWGTLLTLLFERLYQGQCNIYKVWAVFIVYVLLIVHCIGRDNVVQFRRLLSPYLYSIVPSAGCCTQAILYTYHGAREVVGYLNNHHDDLPKDLSSYRFLSESSSYAYYIQPNSFDHIGFYSMVRGKADLSRV